MNIEQEIIEIKRRLNNLETANMKYGGAWKPTPVNTPPTCPRCGIFLNEVMMYSCSILGCPTGLGPIAM